MAELRDSVIRAIVHLNFNEPEQALEVLLVALGERNFEHRKEYKNGNANRSRLVRPTTSTISHSNRPFRKMRLSFQLLRLRSELLRIAVNNNATVDQLTKLMDLQERWERREANAPTMPR